MNLLLLLSAMLSALVGAGPGLRAQQAPVAVASAAQEQAVGSIAARVAARPAQPSFTLIAVAAMGIALLFILPATVPAWKMRRRE